MEGKSVAIGLAIGVIVGGIGGGTGGFFLAKKMYKSPEPKPGQIETTVISGKPGTITHSDWNFKGKSVSFDTKATGKGETKTSFDKALIPEAKKWDSYVHALGPTYTGMYYNYDRTYRHIFGMDYAFRLDWFMLEIGPRLSYYDDIYSKKREWGEGFNVGFKVWFKGKD